MTEVEDYLSTYNQEHKLYDEYDHCVFCGVEVKNKTRAEYDYKSVHFEYHKSQWRHLKNLKELLNL